MNLRPFRWLPALVVGISSPFLYAACGSDAGGDSAFDGGDGGDDATTGDGSGDDSPSIDSPSFGDSGSCMTGQACGDGGICAGSTCCDHAHACGDVCCGAAELCSFQKCVTPGATCHDSSDCASGEYCELSLGGASDGGVPEAGTSDAACMGGAAQLSGKCLPKPPTCAADAGVPDSGVITCLEKCEYHAPSAFNPVLKLAWGGQVTSPFASDVMMTPIVVELDDDDCDGKVTERDIPEIIFTTFASGGYQSAGTLHAISVVGGVVVDKWSVPGVVSGAKQIAGGNFDGQPGNEVVTCGADGAAHAFKGDGTPLWTSPAVTCLMPSIADLDGDGVVEVIVEGAILDGRTGVVEHAFASPLNGSFVVSDIDGDGKLDVVTSSRGYASDGTLFVDTGLAATGQFAGTADWKSPWPAIADFDRDGKPEIVVVDNLPHQVSVWRYDSTQAQKFTVVHGPLDMNAKFPTNTCAGGTWGNTHGGGPPTVADFNADGTPDVGLAGGIGYVVFDGTKLADATSTAANAILWSQPTTDCSSASTGSSVFDFDGDGKAEVVYSDENHMRIYDGTTGSVLVSLCNTTATLIEYPVIADVDNDGHADIVVVSNAYGSGNPELQCNDGAHIAQAGVRIFGDANGAWVRTRPVWNQHAYHITNVDESGGIPQHELRNWTQPGLNDFRQNKQPGSEFAAPDLIVSIAPRCSGAYALVATVRNIGEAAVPAGVVVGFYAGTPPSGMLLGKMSTTITLFPAEAETLTLVLTNPDPMIVSGMTPIYAVVDDTTTPHPSWHECRVDNDTSPPVSGSCSGPR